MTMPDTTQSDLVAKLKALDAAARWRTPEDNSIRAYAAEHQRFVPANIEIRDYLRNAVPEIIAMAEDAARLRAHCEAMQEAIRRAEVGVTAARSFLVIDESSHAERHLADVVQLLVAYRGENAS